MERVNSPVASPLYVVSDIYGFSVTVGPVIIGLPVLLGFCLSCWGLPVLLGFACPVGVLPVLLVLLGDFLSC